MKKKILLPLVLLTVMIIGIIPISAIAAEGVSGDNIARPFTYYFPDEIFAHLIAEHLEMKKEDLVTEKQLKSITSIDSFNYGVTNIDGISYLSNLDTIYFSFAIMSVLPEELCDLDKLEYLSLNGISFNQNTFTELPKNFNKLRNLKHLSIAGSKITEFPKQILNLNNLESLDLRYNNFEIPNEIDNLTMLKTLNLSNIKSNLPNTIGNLKNLILLDISYNDLNDVPNFIEKLINLETLHLSGNNISSIPEYIGKLKNLKMLNLHSNKLQNLPLSIESLTNLKHLYITGNNFTSLPNYIIEKFPDGVSQQSAILPTKTITSNKGIAATDIYPEIIRQLLKYEGISDTEWFTKGSICTFINNNTHEEIKIEWGYDTEQKLYLNSGNYTVFLYTFGDIWVEGHPVCLNTHTFTIPLEIVDSTPQPQNHTYKINGSAKSDKGGYDVTVQGLFEGELEEGRNVLSAAQLANIDIRGIGKHIASGETQAFGTNRLSGADVIVTNGEITEFILYTFVKTTSGLRENVTIKLSDKVIIDQAWNSNEKSINNIYDVYVSGELPNNLSEGKNLFGKAELDTLMLRGFYINNETGETKFITQKQFTSLEVHVTGGKVTKIIATGSAKTPNGVKDNFEIIIDK